MKTSQVKKTEELHMSSAEFDRIMRGVLQAHPEETPKQKRTVKRKPKATRKQSK